MHDLRYMHAVLASSQVRLRKTLKCSQDYPPALSLMNVPILTPSPYFCCHNFCQIAEGLKGLHHLATQRALVCEVLAPHTVRHLQASIFHSVVVQCSKDVDRKTPTSPLPICESIFLLHLYCTCTAPVLHLHCTCTATPCPLTY